MANSNDKSLYLWNVSTGNLVRKFKGHTAVGVTAHAAHDGRRLVSTGLDNTLRLWNVADPQAVWTQDVSGEQIASVVFSPDDRSILTSGADGVLRIREFRRRWCAPDRYRHGRGVVPFRTGKTSEGHRFFVLSRWPVRCRGKSSHGSVSAPARRFIGRKSFATNSHSAGRRPAVNCTRSRTSALILSLPSARSWAPDATCWASQLQTAGCTKVIGGNSTMARQTFGFLPSGC